MLFGQSALGTKVLMIVKKNPKEIDSEHCDIAGALYREK